MHAENLSTNTISVTGNYYEKSKITIIRWSDGTTIVFNMAASPLCCHGPEHYEPQ